MDVCSRGHRRRHWLYLAVVIDLFSRQVIGWSMQSMMHTDLVLRALLAAVWRRKPKQTVIVHSDQGSQFTDYDLQRFTAENNLSLSMSRRANCHDNAVAESFFQLLKREQIKRGTYKNRETAKGDIFDDIEMFYDSKRKHGYLNNQSPADYDNTYFMNQESVEENLVDSAIICTFGLSVLLAHLATMFVEKPSQKFLREFYARKRLITF